MIHVRRATADHLPWLAERAQIAITPALAALEAVRDDGTITAMVGYDGWIGNACMIHVAIEHPAALRHILKPGFGLVFDDKPKGLGFAAVYAPVREDNRASLELVEHLGFKKFHHGKDWIAPGVGLVMHEMRREDCRWAGRS